MNLNRILITTALLLISNAEASATTVTLSSNIENNTVLDQSAPNLGYYGATFDLTTYLTPSKDFNTPYNINSAYFSFTFSSGPNEVFSTTDTGYHLACITCLDTSNVYIRDITHNFYNPYEHVSILNNNIEISSGGTQYFDAGIKMVGDVIDGYVDSHSHYLGGLGNSYYATHTFVHNYGYDGNFTLSGYITDLSSLSNYGAQGFALVVSGLDYPASVYLKSSYLVVDYSSNPLPVPEPETFALILAGLGLLCAATHLRQARADT